MNFWHHFFARTKSPMRLFTFCLHSSSGRTGGPQPTHPALPGTPLKSGSKTARPESGSPLERGGAQRRGVWVAGLSSVLSLLSFVLCLTPAAATPPSPGPLTFEFTVPKADGLPNPFARELWGRVTLPSGQALLLPAYYAGDGRFAVRARPDEIGLYRLDRVSETTRGSAATPVEFQSHGPREINNAARIRLPSVSRDPQNPAAFLRSDRRAFVPVGANLAWPETDCVPYYRSALAAFAQANLNWMRIWMVHWGQLNLDWLPDYMGPSPRPGGLDPRVAAHWDQLLETAATQGVYIQMVLQHHGQYTTGANSNWAGNPWNAAHPGGFLKKPGDFFTDPDARLLTLLKYRYIVARYGWSPAVFAWEFFNEVHWVDAIDKDKNEAAVARWHSDMARFVRSIDAYQHLVTTSTENLRSPIYEQMDFYQPHLYAANMVAAARGYAGPEPLDRPAFYGEVGDDHLAVAPAVKAAGLTLLPPVWASLMGRGILPAQPWEGAKLIATNRLGELGAVHRFSALNRLPARAGLKPFSPALESDTRVPLQLAGTHVWQRRPAPDFAMPLNGSTPIALAEVPRIYVGWPGSIADGFPDHATYHFDFPRALILQAHLAGAGNGEAGIQFLVDGRLVAEKSWPAAGPAPRTWPQTVDIPVPAGPHTLQVRNRGNGDWVDLAALDLGLDTAVLAAIGQRNDTFIAAWVWHRTNLYAMDPLAPATGTVVIDDVPAGTWQITWWDTAQGTAGSPTTVTHPGGVLRISTPAITRHAAVVLTH
jgi:hypothetical protein